MSGSASTLLDLVRTVEPYLAAALVSPATIDRIRSVAGRLPLCSLAGLECRLSDPESTVDLLMGLSPQVLQPQGLPESAVWDEIRALCSEAANTGSALHDRLAYLWLEFDSDAEAVGLLFPGVFLAMQGFRPDLHCVLHLLRRLPWRGQRPAEIERNVERYLHHLPPEGSLSHVGMMTSRPENMLRIVVRGIPPDGQVRYLQRIGWDYDPAPLRRLIAWLSPLVDGISILDIDVGTEIGPRIGLECFMTHDEGMNGRWRRFLTLLTDRGLCGPEKRAALWTWPGVCNLAGAAAGQSPAPGWSGYVWGGRVVGVVQRSINHIKIVYEPEGTCHAKSYLAFRHLWVDRRILSAGVP